MYVMTKKVGKEQLGKEFKPSLISTFLLYLTNNYFKIEKSLQDKQIEQQQ